MRANHVHIGRKIWGRVAIASLLIAELSAVPAVVPGVLTAAAAPPAAPGISVTPVINDCPDGKNDCIIAGDSYVVSGSHFDPTQKVTLNVLPACVNLPAGNPAKPGTPDPTCATDGGHPELFPSGVVSITPAADGSFSQSFFSSPLLTDATYNIFAKSQAPGAANSVETSDNDQKRQAAAGLTVRTASPTVTLSTPVIPDFFYIGATMTGFAPNELVCVADFTTFGNCTPADGNGSASIPLPPACLPPPVGTSATLTCLHPIAQNRQGLLPITTSVMAVGATSLRTAATKLSIVPEHSALAAIFNDGTSLTLKATGMLPNDPVQFPKGRFALADSTGTASVTYPLACPPAGFPAGMFTVGVFGQASNLSPQTDVTIPAMGCPAPAQTLTASPPSISVGDNVTLTATNFTPFHPVFFSVDAPFPLNAANGGRLLVGPVIADAAGTASTTFALNCCGQLKSELLIFAADAADPRQATQATYGTPNGAFDGFVHVFRPTPTVNPISDTVRAGDSITLVGSGFKPHGTIDHVQLFLGDVLPCPATTAPGQITDVKCTPIVSNGGPNRGLTNLGAPSFMGVVPDANGNFAQTVRTSYLTFADTLSPTALPFDTTNPGASVSIQHGNTFVTIQRFHPQISALVGDDRTLVVSGSGYVPGEPVNVTAGGAGRATVSVTADPSGSFSTTPAVQPTAPTGSYSVAATGVTSNLFAATPILVNSKRAVFSVNTTDDAAQQPGAGATCASTLQGRCTLRAAIQAANALGGGEHVISLHAQGTYSLTVTGTGEEDASAGDLDVDQWRLTAPAPTVCSTSGPPNPLR